MRMKIMKVIRAAARWMEAVLEVRLPMDIVAGLPHPTGRERRL
jgi:hypothetical protein